MYAARVAHKKTEPKGREKEEAMHLEDRQKGWLQRDCNAQGCIV